ncbi:hypothetical protein CRG98_019327, partial [Punica granatum]
HMNSRVSTANTTTPPIAIPTTRPVDTVLPDGDEAAAGGGGLLAPELEGGGGGLRVVEGVLGGGGDEVDDGGDENGAANKERTRNPREFPDSTTEGAGKQLAAGVKARQRLPLYLSEESANMCRV